MIPSGVTIPATVPQRTEIPEGLMNYPVYIYIYIHQCFVVSYSFHLQGRGINVL